MTNPSSDARHTEQIEAHGLKALRLSYRGSEALVYLHGGHVASFRTARHGELLWISEQAVYQAGQPIRGGVPLCFPWFGPHPSRSDLPPHGFARLGELTWDGAEERDGALVASLSLRSDARTKAAWPHEFRARLSVTLGDELTLGFEVENTDSTPFEYQLALHTYLAVSDVHQVSVNGLQGASYLDKVDGHANLREGSGPLRLTGETDRVYQSAARVTVDDPGRGRRLFIDKSGSSSTVVWNPWLEKAKRITDMGDDEWPRMLCVEAANAGLDRVALAPGERHVTATKLWAEALD